MRNTNTNKFFLAALLIISFGVVSCGKESTTTDTNSSEQPAEEIVDGRLSGVFSVSENLKVRFSQGNLQYCATQNLWRFAERQYDYIGENNERIASNYSGWIDLFGWGTSGWASGANCYEPWSTSSNSEDYFVGGNYKNDLTGTYKNADWGVFNQIENGGEQINWRTLSYNEWTALIGSENLYTNVLPIRQNKTGYGAITIGNRTYNGIIIVPDDWITPEGCEFYGYSERDSYINQYDENHWKIMESNGAVFLPYAGQRRTGLVEDLGEKGHYWTTSAVKQVLNGKYYSYSFDIYHYTFASSGRGFGYSVRLVTEKIQ